MQLDENDDSEKEDTNVEDACVEKDNATTLDNEKRRFRREDEKFWSLYNELASHLRKSLQSDRDKEYNLFIQASSQKNLTITDHLGLSLLHIAAEKSNNVLAKSLVFIGCNVNAKEHCGLTPLHLAVLSSIVNLCAFLVEANAAYTGPMFSGIPSSKQMAEKLHLEEITALFVKDLTVATKEDDLIKLLDSVSVGESDDAME